MQENYMAGFMESFIGRQTVNLLCTKLLEAKPTDFENRFK
jgi:hypothetical protein